MNNNREDQSGEGRFQGVQPLRDLESNWAVDLAKNLEEYLLKICSGEVSGNDDSHLSVNFAEAALLLQGSIQVYSRKVEYLYNLVLHALEFISQKSSQPDQPENASAQPEESVSHSVPDEENDLFWGLDDVPVEAKNSLDSTTGKDVSLNHFVKPPANLVVLEGDCLDIGDGGELESYLLATNDLYRDFILLDLCDATTVDDFLKGDVGRVHNRPNIGSSLKSKTRKSFLSPTRRSGGTAHKLSRRKSQNVNPNQSPRINCSPQVHNFNLGPDPPSCGIPAFSNHGFDTDDGLSDHRGFDDSDDDDPWNKPLNPHEPGNLKVKPFQKVKAFKRHGANSTNLIPITRQFPLAKLRGTISPELTEMWETQRQACDTQPESSPLYEKLRQTLIHGGNENCGASSSSEVGNEDNGYHSDISDFGQPDFGMPQNIEDVPLHPHEKPDDGPIHFETREVKENEDPHSQASLEDLCRSHLDSLLASIAETEKQTELAARVSTWKQRIEHNLEEQDSRPPFDIHEYGERILEKLHIGDDNENVMSFGDVVRGQEKHDIARTFSALLQLVNNRDVDLERGKADGQPVCYTAVNPFHVRLLRRGKKREEVQLRSSKKRVKSPMKVCADKSAREKPPSTDPSSSSGGSVRNFSVNLRRCTPEGKRRRRSRLDEPVDLHSAG